MPENHSQGGNWHGGKKETCVRCGYIAPKPVVIEVKPVKPKAKPEPKFGFKPKAKKEKVTNAKL